MMPPDVHPAVRRGAGQDPADRWTTCAEPALPTPTGYWRWFLRVLSPHSPIPHGDVHAVALFRG
jgi:hypothetical protein